MQEGNVICYDSHKLKEHERKYVTHELDLDTIVHALKIWRHYLLGKKIKLRTNQMSLRNLFKKPNLNANKPDGWNIYVS